VSCNDGFAKAVRTKRRELELTQGELARRIGTSTPTFGLLEANQRHPAERVVIKLAEVLRLDSRKLFLLANPQAPLLVETPASGASAWEEFPRTQNSRSFTT
jgi:DNA-binding XRE family transcriptional regulator